MFAQRLKQLRSKKKRSQQEMANLLGITRQGYAKYENSDSEPSFEMLQKIADYFNVTIDDLLGHTSVNETIGRVTVAGKEINLSIEELQLFNELKKHPIMFHDLASDPEKKVKELIKLYKMKKLLMEDDDDDLEDGFGELED